MTKFRLVAVLVAGLALAASANAAPFKHALVKVAGATIKAPKYSLVALKDTLGSVLFTAEAGVDVVHAGTAALAKVGSMELKKNPFVVVDKVVAKADSGLEKGYLFFFHAQI